MKLTRRLLSIASSVGILAVSLSAAVVTQVAAEENTVAVGTEFPMSSYGEVIRERFGDLPPDNAQPRYEIEGAIDSPWQPQIKDGTDWVATDSISPVGGDIYIVKDKNGTIGGGAYPGAFTNVSAPDKYLFGLTPISGWGEPYGTHDAAWSFRAPVSGYYTFSPLPEADSADASKSNVFCLYDLVEINEDESTGPQEYGVRITVNNKKIWPEDKEWETISRDNSPEVPTKEMIKMTAGQQLRIEVKANNKIGPIFTNRLYINGHMTYVKEPDPDSNAPTFGAGELESTAVTHDSITLTWPQANDNETDPADITYTMYASETEIDPANLPTTGGVMADSPTSGVITGLKAETTYYVAVVASDAADNKAVLTAGPITTRKIPVVLETYEAYDYFEDIADYANAQENPNGPHSLSNVETDSPWQFQYKMENRSWTTVDSARMEGQTMYVSPSVDAVNIFYPGGGYNAAELSEINPHRNFAFTSPVYNSERTIHSALAFVAPEAGVYSFEKSDPDASFDVSLTDYFVMFDSGATADVRGGVRITVDDQVIWPTEADAAADPTLHIEDGWAILTGRYNNAEYWRAAVPTLNDIEMKAGSVFRIETCALTVNEGTSYQRISALGNMKLMERVEEEDTTAPTFAQGGIEATATSMSLTLTWPTATDDQTADGALTYTAYLGTEPFNTNEFPTEGGENVTGLDSFDFFDLQADTEYYAAIVVTDLAGNKTMLTGGPFKTNADGDDGDGDIGGGDDDEDDSNITPPDAPLDPTMPANSSGIIDSTEDSVQIGWNPQGGVQTYRAYLFVVDGDNYTLELSSGDLNSLTTSTEFNGLEAKNYVIQVVGYNMQGSPIAVYDQLSLDLSGGGSGITDGGNTGNQGGGNSDPIPPTGVRAATMLLLAIVPLTAIVIMTRRSKSSLFNLK